MTAPRTKFQAIQGSKPDQILILGGKDSESQRIQTIEQFDVRTQEWQPLLDAQFQEV